MIVLSVRFSRYRPLRTDLVSVCLRPIAAVKISSEQRKRKSAKAELAGTCVATDTNDSGLSHSPPGYADAASSFIENLKEYLPVDPLAVVPKTRIVRGVVRLRTWGSRQRTKSSGLTNGG